MSSYSPVKEIKRLNERIKELKSELSKYKNRDKHRRVRMRAEEKEKAQRELHTGNVFTINLPEVNATSPLSILVNEIHKLEITNTKKQLVQHVTNFSDEDGPFSNQQLMLAWDYYQRLCNIYELQSEERVQLELNVNPHRITL